MKKWDEDARIRVHNTKVLKAKSVLPPMNQLPKPRESLIH